MGWLLCAIALIGFEQQIAQPDPRVVIVRATRAVEGDSAESVALGWTRLLDRDSSDASAALGLATLARLRYDYTTSDALFNRLIRRDRAGTNAYSAAARLELGRSFHVRGQNARADSQLAAAVSIAERAGSPGLEADALIALAIIRARTIAPGTADSLLERAALRLEPHDLIARSEYHCVRAALLQMTGRQNVASEARTGAEFARQAGAPRQQAYCLRVLAVSVIDRGGLEEGFALLDTVVERLNRVHDRASLARVLQWRGYHFYTSYEYGRAREDLLRAVTEGTASGEDSAVAWALLNLGMLSSSAGDLISARAYGDNAAALFESQNDLWGLGSLRAFQGQVAYLGGDRVNAGTRLRDALETANEIGYVPSIVAIRIGLALLAMDDADLAAAEYHLNAARDVAVRNRLDGWERGLTYHFARLAMLNGRLDIAERELRSVLTGGTAADAAQPGAAYEWRSRLADVLMRQGRIADAEAELRHATDALDSARTGLTDQELRTIVLQSLHDMQDPVVGAPRVLAGLVMNDRVESAFVLADRRKARSMLERVVLRDALRTRVTTTAVPIESKRLVSPAVTMADVSAALPERTALLEYVTGADGSPTTLFVISRSGGVAIVLAPLDSIAADVRRLITLIEEGEDPTHLARLLGIALIDSAMARLPADVNRLVIVADAGLNRVPFDALISIHGRMLERFSITIAPSAGVAVQLWKRPASRLPVELLALGDPTPGPAIAYTLFFGDGVLERLPESGRESRMVARYAPAATVRLRDQASEAWLTRASLRRYRVLHFAAHALVDEHTPMRTALALSPGDGEDGFIQGADLAALDLDADLVVLSACRTAGGAFVYGEGVEGLTGPLLEAGARGVVASLWRVGDRTAAEFVRTFYDALAAGQPTGDALTTAKREALRRGQPPAVWAAFTLVGNPDVRIPLQRPERRATVWIVAFTMIAAIGIALGYGVFMRTSRSVDRTRIPSAVTASTHQRKRSTGETDTESGNTTDVSV